MGNDEFAKKFQDMYSLINNYLDKNDDLNYESAEILAIKKVLELKDRNLQSKYLGLDRVLDSINYVKKFDREREMYEVDVGYVFFDSDVPENRIDYLHNISKKSNMFKRLIASRLQREILSETSKKQEKLEKKVKEEWATVYDLAKIYLKHDAPIQAKEFAIEKTIEDIVNNYQKPSQLKILGEEPFLDLWCYKKRMNNGEYKLFEEEIRSVFKYPEGISDEEYWDFVKNSIEEDWPESADEIIYQKVRKEHFPIEGAEYLEEDGSYGEDSEDD